MADNSEFDPTQSLGPEFGGINQPSTNPQSFKPFEGSPMNFPTIDFPKSLGLGSLTNNNDLVRDVIHTGKDVSTKDRIKAIGDYISGTSQEFAPNNSSAKIFSYDASPDGNAFYDRYAAYGDEKFAKIGFSPFRDNESIFNARTSWWDDHKRMMQHSFWPLFSSGFVSGPKSLMRMINGDMGADPEDAAIYANAAAIGQSSKSGLGSFFNNTAMNFGYTAGIITEAVVEEVAGLLLAIPTGGTSAVVTNVNIARNLARIPEAFKAIKGIGNIADFAKGINQTLKQVDNVAGARSFWNAARSKAGRFVNPFENITEAVYQLKQNENNLTGMARGFATINKTAGGFYRDVRNVNMALAEARLEGGFVQNEVYDNLYNNFLAEHGVAPDDKLQKDMRNQAVEASMETLTWNTALIYGSNKIVIPNIMGPRGGIRNFMTSKLAQEIKEVPAGKIIKTTGEKIAGKLHKPIYSLEQKGWKSSWNSFKRNPLTSSALGVGKYFKANFTEGLQENAQDVIAESLKNFYVQSFQNPEMATHLYSKGVYAEALKEQFSARGFETFASGFFMGMFAVPLNHAVPAMSIGFNKITDPKGYAEMKEQRNQRGQNVVDNLNEMTQDPNAFFDSKLFNYAMQSNSKDGIAMGTDKEGIDAREHSFINQMNTAIENNSLDNFLEHIESFSELTTEEFEEALGYEKGTGAEKQQEIGAMITKAREIEKRHKYYNERFPDQVNMKDLEVGTDEYNAAAIYKNARRISIRNAVFFGEAFDNTMSRMNGIMNKVFSETGLKNVSVSDIQNIFNNERMTNEIEILKTEVEALKTSTDPTSKSKLGDKQRKLDSYNRFNEASLHFQDWIKKQRYDSERLEEISLDILEEHDTKVLTEFERAYKEHMRTLGTLSKDHVFDENLDKSFELLLDYYKLEDEAGHLGKYVNFLHDPKNFTDNIERNYEWMEELYRNRSQYYDELVEKGLSDVENNNLLNTLANRDIYISKEDLENFIENEKIPEEFYSAERKAVIRKTHPLYAEIRNEFLSLIESRKTTKTKEFLKEAQEEIDKLTIKEQAEKDALPTIDQREEIGTITKIKLRKLGIKRIESELGDGEYAEALDVNGDTSTFYKDGAVLKYDDIDGNPVRVDEINITFNTVKKYKIVKAPDPVAVKEITDKYTLLKAEVLNNAIKNAKEAQTGEYIPITSTTPIDELPLNLKEELLVGVPAYMEEFKLIGNPEEHLASYMKMAEAETIIDAYNIKQEELFRARAEGMVEPRNLPRGNKMVSSAEMSIEELDTLRQEYTNKVEIAENKLSTEELTPAETLKLSEDKEILNYLDRYILFRKTSDFSPKAQEAIKQIEYLKSIQDRITLTDFGYVIDGKLHTRVTQSYEDLKTTKYELKDIHIDSIKSAYNQTIGQGLPVIEFINKIKKSNIPAFSLFTANELTAAAIEVANRLAIPANTPGLKEVKAEIARLDAEITSAEGQDNYVEILKANKNQIKELTLQLPITETQAQALLINEIKEKTYEHTRIGGNEIDGLVKDFFDNVDQPFEYKSEYASRITEEAFNNIFGAPTDTNPAGGVIYHIREKVKSGQLYVAAAVKVYDSTALNGKGVAGEIDLLVVDQEGNVSIVDIKTGNAAKWKGFRTLTGPVEKRSDSALNKTEEYSMQQTAYSNLLFNMTGIDANINILPIETELDEETEFGKVLTAKDPGINKGGDWYSLTKVDAIDTIISRKAVPIKTGGAPVNVLTEKEKEILEEPMGETDDASEEQAYKNLGRRISNEEALKRKISSVLNNKKILSRDIDSINDTLAYLDELLDSTVELGQADVNMIIKNIEVLKQSIKSNSAQKTKRGKNTVALIEQLQKDLKGEFRLNNDILNRVKDLKQEVQQLEAIKKDLTNQVNYYNNMIADENYQTLGQEEIREKISKIKKKISIIEKIINAIKKAISKSLFYLQEYIKLWSKTYKGFTEFQTETGYKELSQEEINELINSLNSDDQTKLADYPGLSRQFKALENQVLDSMDNVELIEEVLDGEKGRLSELNTKLDLFHDQIRYLEELIAEPMTEAEPISSKDKAAPKPVESKKQEKETTTSITEDEYKNFIDNGIVSDERITAIATKYMNNDEMSMVEIEIFTDKTAEVNAKIVELSGETELTMSDLGVSLSDLGIQEEPIDKQLTISDIDTMVRKVSSKERVEDLKAYLAEQFLAKNMTDEVYNAAIAMADERMVQIEEGINLELTIDSFTEGQQLMVKIDIFTGTTNKFASINDTVIVKSISEGKILVSPFGRPNVSKVISEADINKYFTTMDLEKAKAKVADKPLTKEDKEIINQGNNTAESLIKDGDALATLRKDADTLSMNDIEDTLLDESICI